MILLSCSFSNSFSQITVQRNRGAGEEDDLKALADGCDLLVIPTTPDVLTLDALMLTVKALQAIGTDNYRVLLTIVPPRPSRDGDEARSLLRQGQFPFLNPASAGLLLFRRLPWPESRSSLSVIPGHNWLGRITKRWGRRYCHEQVQGAH